MRSTYQELCAMQLGYVHYHEHLPEYRFLRAENEAK